MVINHLVHPRGKFVRKCVWFVFPLAFLLQKNWLSLAEEWHIIESFLHATLYLWPISTSCSILHSWFINLIKLKIFIASHDTAHEFQIKCSLDWHKICAGISVHAVMLYINAQHGKCIVNTSNADDFDWMNSTDFIVTVIRRYNFTNQIHFLSFYLLQNSQYRRSRNVVIKHFNVIMENAFHIHLCAMGRVIVTIEVMRHQIYVKIKVSLRLWF